MPPLVPGFCRLCYAAIKISAQCSALQLEKNMMRSALATAALLACTSALAPQRSSVALEASSRRKALAFVPAVALVLAPRAWAGVLDEEMLKMPTQEEVEAGRITRKLAAQNADRGTPGGGRLTVKEKMESEQEKQKTEKKKSKSEQREDLCELLGRGC